MHGALSWPFVRLYLLTLFYFSANSILNVIIPLKGEALGASNTVIGMIMGAYLFTAMIFRPWAGRVIQKYGAIKVLRVILALNGIALVAYAFTGLGGHFVARVLQGGCTAFFSMALQLGIIDALPDRDRSQGISMYSLCSYLPGILGPFLAIGLWQGGELNGFTAVMIAIAAATGLVGYTARINAPPSDTTPGAAASNTAGAGPDHQGKAMLRSFSQLVHNPHLFRSSVLMLGASVVFGAAVAFMPLYASQVEGGSAALYLMLQAVVVVIARFALRKRIPSDGKWHAGYMIGVLLLIAAASLCISLAVVGGADLLYPGALLMGLAQALLYPTLTTYLSFALPVAERNVLMGLFIAMADLGVSLGGMVMGPVADLSSYSTMYLICAVLGAALVPFAIKQPDRAPGTAK